MTKENFNLGRFRVDGHVLIGRPDGDYIEVVCEGDELPRALAGEVRASSSSRRIPAAAATTLPPLDPAARVFAIAINYRAHGDESKAPPPERPLIFYKAPSNFVAHNGILNPNKKITSKFDYEGEVPSSSARPARTYQSTMP